jgi:N-acetylneuraminic acid mutarotase
MRIKFIFLFYAVCGIATAQNTWVQKPFFGGGTRMDASGFSIGSKAYILAGMDTSLTRDMWEYDTLTTVWTRKSDFPGSGRRAAVAFAIGNKGYCGTGLDSNGYARDFWEYDPALDTWTQKADFGGTARYYAVGFAIGNKGYIGTGNDGANQNDFWEYDPANDTWTMKAFFTGLERLGAFGFSIGNKGYIGGGSNSYNDFYEYNPVNDTWTQKTDVPGSDLVSASGFSIGTVGYLFTGYGNLHGYNPVSDRWVGLANLLQGRNQAVGFSIGNKGYIGTGHDGNGTRRDFWQYTPCTSFPIANFNLYPDTEPLHYIAENLATGTAPLTYFWSWGDGTGDTTAYPSHTYDIAGNYTICLSVTDEEECSDTYCNDYAFKTASPIAYIQVIDPLTSIQDNTLNPFSIYPNPAANTVNVELNASVTSGESIYQLQDITGKVLLSGLASGDTKFNLDISALSKGIYLLSLIDGEQQVNRKIVKE